MEIDLLSEWQSKYNRTRAARMLLQGKVLATGLVGHRAAGRDLTLADFSTRGLAAPRALWNFSNALTDASGNGYTFTNAGGVVFDKGINGLANEAVRFDGGATSYLTASNAVKVPHGSFGFWFKLNRSDVAGTLLSFQDGTGMGIRIDVSATGRLVTYLGTAANLTDLWSNTSWGRFVADGRWHFLTVTWDGLKLVSYVDGDLDANDMSIFSGAPTRGPMYQPATQVLTIGSVSSTVSPYRGWIDELFITEQILTTEQHRWLYAAKVPYTLPIVTTNVEMIVERYGPNAVLAASDFSTQPLVGYNFNGPSGWTTDDFGSLGRTLTDTGTKYASPGPDGAKEGSLYFNGSTAYFSASDTGLPSGTGTRSVGVWARNIDQGAVWRALFCYGNRLGLFSSVSSVPMYGRLHVDYGAGGSDYGDRYDDGRWHFFVMTYNDSAFDGARGRVYADGELVGIVNASQSVTLNGTMTIGRNSAASNLFFDGQIACAFVCGYELTAEEILSIFAKRGILRERGPVDPSAFIEAITDTDLYVIASDLGPRTQIEVRAL